MAWRKVPPELTALLTEVVAPFAARPRQMFGCPCWFAGDHMFVGAHQESILLRLDEADRQALREAFDEVEAFEPIAGRPMREYVVVPEALLADRDELRAWIGRAHRYAASLPPKPPKPARPKTRAKKPPRPSAGWKPARRGARRG